MISVRLMWYVVYAQFVWTSDSQIFETVACGENHHEQNLLFCYWNWGKKMIQINSTFCHHKSNYSILKLWIPQDKKVVVSVRTLISMHRGGVCVGW